MTEAKVWKMGDKYAGISARGKRVVKNTKAAAEKAVGITGKKSKSSKKVVKTRKKVRKTAKKKTKRRYSMTIPLAPVLGLAAPLVHSIPWFKQDIVSGFNDLSASILGYDFKAAQFDWNTMKRGLVPIVLGLLVHKFIGGKLGVNRMLGRAKIPLLRL